MDYVMLEKSSLSSATADQGENQAIIQGRFLTPEVESKLQQSKLIDSKFVKFSKASISEKLFWDTEKYEPIMVVKFKYSEGCQITSIDNRRLHSAQVANISELLVDCHDSTDIIDDKISRKRFQCLIAFCDGDKSCFTIVLYPKVYGAIVMSRSALQTSKFSVHGTYGTPYIGQRPKSTHYWDDDFDTDCDAVKKTEFPKREGLRKDTEDDQNRQEKIDKLLAERESELLRARDDAYHEYRVPQNVEYGITL